ncbi:MAG: porin family protein [Chitinophagaceae bacterium]
MIKMKKCAIALLLSLCVYHAAQAQDFQDSTDTESSSLNPRIGIKGSFIGAFNSVTFLNSTAEAATSMGPRLSWGVGAYLDIPFDEKWGVQLGLNYASLGTKLKKGYYLNQNYTVSQNLKYNYLTIPILARYNIGTSGWSVLAGPQFGVLLSARRQVSSTNANVKSYLKSSDWAGVAGLEYKLPVHSFLHDMRVGASFQYGLTNIIKDMDTYSSYKLYNNAANVYVGFTL